MAVWSRRAFLLGVAIAATVGGTPWVRLRRVTVQALQASPVVSLHMDEPYIDLRGHGLAYEARGFTDGAGPLRSWSEEQWRMNHPYS